MSAWCRSRETLEKLGLLSDSIELEVGEGRWRWDRGPSGHGGRGTKGACLIRLICMLCAN